MVAGWRRCGTSCYLNQLLSLRQGVVFFGLAPAAGSSGAYTAPITQGKTQSAGFRLKMPPNGMASDVMKRSTCLQGGQIHTEGGPLPRLTGGRDGPAMIGRYLFADG